MIFETPSMEIIDAWEDSSGNLHVIQGMDIGEHLKMCYELRQHDEQNGISGGRQFQHVASLDEVTASRLAIEKPEVLQDRDAMEKWLNTETDLTDITKGGSLFRTARPAKPIKGDGLQVIVK